MSKNDFKDYICRPYCMYFKEGQKEEMACQGAQVVDSLVHDNRIKTETIQGVVKDSRLWHKHRVTLERYVCRQCSFRAEDCDFQSLAPSEDMEPCGGYVVLAFLTENNQVEKRTLEIVK